ncbi:MAG: 30S ribosomal protein S6 [Candidatus Binataceae bacterium]|nr:30S ribosomal protein S6 [Candidatus Binataceae bacterium]
MRRYETVFILRPDLGEAQTKETIKRFEGIVSSNAGELIETDEWGMRELAYHIKGERRGHYVRLDYVAPETTTHEVERNLKLADPVLRYLSVLVDDNADVAKARAEVEANRQRIAQNREAAEAAMQARAARDRGEPIPAAAAAAEEESIPDAPEGLADLETPVEPESEGQ